MKKMADLASTQAYMPANLKSLPTFFHSNQPVTLLALIDSRQKRGECDLQFSDFQICSPILDRS